MADHINDNESESLLLDPRREDDDRYLSLGASAEKFGVSKRTLYRMIADPKSGMQETVVRIPPVTGDLRIHLGRFRHLILRLRPSNDGRDTSRARAGGRVSPDSENRAPATEEGDERATRTRAPLGPANASTDAETKGPVGALGDARPNVPRKGSGGRGRGRVSLRGTHLHRTRTGFYMWRAPDDGTGRRPKRSTGTRYLEQARKIADQYMRDYVAVKMGLEPSKQDGWAKRLAPLAEAFIAFEKDEGKLLETTGETKRFRLLRAFEVLNLRSAANLDHVASIDKHLKDHGKAQEPVLTREHLRRSYQEPLKQFSAWMAANKRHLDRDPLSAWAPIRSPRAQRDTNKFYRAFTGEEMARALLASERLDAFHDRPVRLRPVFMALLVTGSRPGALLERDVAHLLSGDSRIDLGRSKGNKRRGEAALDRLTLEEIKDYVGNRTDGPLFLGPKRARLNINKIQDYWLEAFGLGLVDVLWPAGEQRGLRVAYLVSLYLATDRLAVSFGGDPKTLKPKTLTGRQDFEGRVRRIAETMRQEWERRMENVAAYGLRTTHRTWAELKGVPGVVIDKQLGHGKRSEALVGPLQRLLNGSATGRDHYIDPALFDASRSATVVRELLEEGMQALDGVETILKPESLVLPAEKDEDEENREDEDDEAVSAFIPSRYPQEPRLAGRP